MTDTDPFAARFERDTGRDMHRAVGSWSHEIPSHRGVSNLARLKVSKNDFFLCLCLSRSLYLSRSLAVSLSVSLSLALSLKPGEVEAVLEQRGQRRRALEQPLFFNLNTWQYFNSRLECNEARQGVIPFCSLVIARDTCALQ